MLRVIIIDDERRGRMLLKTLLEEYCSGVEVVGDADSVATGIEAIRLHSPDIVFLDIEMPGGNGFNVIDAFDNPGFKVVFTTAYDQYAIKAIKYSALDYLLKPIEIGDLVECVERVGKILKYQGNLKMVAQEALGKPGKDIQQLIIPDHNSFIKVELSQILWLEAEGSYVNFFLEGDRKITASKSIGYYEDLLPTDRFFRIHNSSIVNKSQILVYEKGRGGSVKLQNGTVLDVSTRKKLAFLKWMQG